MSNGYDTDVFYVSTPNGSLDAMGALEEAVVLAEKTSPSVLKDVDEVERAIAEAGHYDFESGVGDNVFEKTYIHVDATMAGAARPYYVLTDGFSVRDNVAEIK